LILEAFDWDGTPIHACRSCGGCWLEGADFSRIQAGNAGRFTELDTLFPTVASSAMFEGLPRACPNCRSNMLERAADSQGDANPLTCNRCHGVWLEAGERGLRSLHVATAAAAPVPIPGVTSTTAASVISAPETQKAADSEIAAVSEIEEVASPPLAETQPTPDAAYVPEPVGPEDAAPASKPDGPAAPAVPWLPHTSDSMPDPRPISRRGAPLTAEAAEEVAQKPPAYRPQRWCPQCRHAYPATESECVSCGIGLAEGGYKIQCLRCGSENNLSTEFCWKCRANIHAESGSPAPPPIPGRKRAAERTQAPPSGIRSCGATVVVLIAGCLAALQLVLLLVR
jgi:Zn-finger nucleic acid-binding protein